jgi:hypothetical protein
LATILGAIDASQSERRTYQATTLLPSPPHNGKVYPSVEDQLGDAAMSFDAALAMLDTDQPHRLL